MKRLKLVPVLLVMLLTGCGAPRTVAPVDSMVTLTETPTAAPTETTEPATEAPTAPPTAPAPETSVQMVPAGEQEERAYQFIREELIPQYRLSDTAFFSMSDQNGTIPVPPLTQGLVSAYIRDLDGDQNAELLTIRVSEYEFIADVYVPVEGGSFMPLDSEMLASYDAQSLVTPTVTMQGNNLLVRTSITAVPDASSYGTQVTSYRIDREGITQTAQIKAYRSPGRLYCAVNEQESESPEEPDSLDYAGLGASMQQAFVNSGVDCTEVHFGWGYGNEYGAEVAFPGENLIFMVDHVPDSGTFFLDNTGLREHLG